MQVKIYCKKNLLCKQHLTRGKHNRHAEHLHSLLQLIGRGVGGGDTDILILGVDTVGVCRARARQYNACVFAKFNRALCRTFKTVEGYEVAAVRLVP